MQTTIDIAAIGALARAAASSASMGGRVPAAHCWAEGGDPLRQRANIARRLRLAGASAPAALKAAILAQRAGAF